VSCHFAATDIAAVKIFFILSSNHFGCDCSMLETLYQTIFHD
jgi:hypothetical protein